MQGNLDLLQSLLQGLLQGKAPHIRGDTSGIDPSLLLLGSIHEQLSTQMVRFLLDPKMFPNKPTNDLCQLFWKLVGSRVSSMAVVDNLHSLHFLGVKDTPKDPFVCVVMIPKSFLALMIQDPWMQLGALVFVASQAQDFWNQKIVQEDVIQRARANEAEFLRGAQRFSSFHPNEYQQQILAAYPSGSLAKWSYASQAFDLTQAQANFKDPSGQGIVEPTDPFMMPCSIQI